MRLVCYYYSHFPDEAAEAQGGETIFPVSPSQRMAEPGFEPWHLVSRPGPPSPTSLHIHLLGFVMQDLTFLRLSFLIWDITSASP